MRAFNFDVSDSEALAIASAEVVLFVAIDTAKIQFLAGKEERKFCLGVTPALNTCST